MKSKFSARLITQNIPPFLVQPEFSLHCLQGFHDDPYPWSEEYNIRP
jgi:hypothetical protein